ncbi:MAG: archaemetzincin family Zn-dependent metalloprotease [Desulfobacterales bacterium]|nr:MAG: archaemetzincin family Zn-dependent metalloprotease [Desulfobacterales bacterium]
MSPESEYNILIAPVGEFDPALFAPVSREIQRIFGYPTQVRPLLEDLTFALDPNRDQYHSTPILEKLAREAPPSAVKVLALVPVDLFIPILTHVYGEAQLGGKASIVSTYRLNDGPSAMNIQGNCLGRVIKEAIHELGHTFNLRHCQDHTCIMHYCRSEADVDRKSDQLCRYCKVFLDDERKRLAL